MKFLVVIAAVAWLIVLVLCNLGLLFAMSSGVTAWLVSIFGILTILLCVIDSVAPKLKRHIDADTPS